MRTCRQVEESSEAEKLRKRYWNDDEHERFLEALDRFGFKAVKAISDFVGTRTPVQVRPPSPPVRPFVE